MCTAFQISSKLYTKIWIVWNTLEDSATQAVVILGFIIYTEDIAFLTAYSSHWPRRTLRSARPTGGVLLGYSIILTTLHRILCMVLLTVRTHGPYYTNSGYLPCAQAHGRSATQWLITVRLTSRPNVSDQLTLLPVWAQTTQVGLLE